MKAEELRVGNVIGWSHEESVSEHIVTAKDIADLEYLSKYSHDPEERFARGAWHVPIPLTPEILERCGFELYTSTAIKGKPFIIFRKRTFRAKFIDGEFAGLSYNSGATDVKHLKYLHQLQNLFYSVYGYELTPSQELPIK